VNGETVYGLRMWENADLVPRPEDLFQERLYCVRWAVPGEDRVYAAVDSSDLAREAKALSLVKQQFGDWQAKGYIPSRSIPHGDETTRLYRERGWTHWHHLFTPRQLVGPAKYLQPA
jgi:adenine-specific DNA methylase